MGLAQQHLRQQRADQGAGLDITKVVRLVIPLQFLHLKEAAAALVLVLEQVQTMVVEVAVVLLELVLTVQAQQAETEVLEQYPQLVGHL